MYRSCLNILTLFMATFLGSTEAASEAAEPYHAWKALCVGNNTLAVECRQNTGGQFIDVKLSSRSLRSMELRNGGMVLRVRPEGQYYTVELLGDQGSRLLQPSEGLWSVATTWKNDWPGDWVHARPHSVQRMGPWLVLEGKVATPPGDWLLRDAYIPEGELIRCVRRWTWTGKQPAEKVTLSVRWQIPRTGAQAFLPGICYYGNPSGNSTRFGHVAGFNGEPGEELLCEEHRFPMPYASLEWKTGERLFGAALHTLPSMAPHANIRDQWWSMGVIGRDKAAELTLLSGPCAFNGQRNFVKANQQKLFEYPDTWMDIPPEAVVEKTFYLQAYPLERPGTGFQKPMRASIDLFHPFGTDGLPAFDSIVQAKYQFTKSRWHEDAESAGIRMYPHNNEYVMGWAGQSGSPGYSLLVLADRIKDPDAVTMAQLLMDHLSGSPFNEQGFMIRYDPDKNRWYGQDPVSQGQAMENFARAIGAGRKMENVNTSKWETFLKKASDVHASRILEKQWKPASTNEGFLVSPLCKAYALFGNETNKKAAIKAAEHYAARHLDMTEPYWGGTLDARCEDKEGAWAGFQAFLAVYEMTGDKKYLGWAEHAMDVTLSYTVIWDIDMPPGRLSDHALQTRGWTVVSAQNQHLDVFGVLYTPEIYRMGRHLIRNDLKELAIVMYRSCGQMLDPLGSQGEQLNHTNFVQGMNIQDVQKMRGTYNERWTVYWITAHFLNAAAQFTEMGVHP